MFDSDVQQKSPHSGIMFTENDLHAGEELIVNSKPHPWFYLFWVVQASVVSFFFLVALVAGATIAGETITKLTVYLVSFSFFAASAFAYYRWKKIQYIVTNQRIIARSSLLSVESVEIPIQSVTNINLSQSLIGRLIGSGDVRVQSAGSLGGLCFSLIADPEAVRNTIHSAVKDSNEKYMSQDGEGEESFPLSESEKTKSEDEQDAVVSLTGMSPAEVLGELTKMKDAGLISEEEFVRRRSVLLGTI